MSLIHAIRRSEEHPVIYRFFRGEHPVVSGGKAGSILPMGSPAEHTKEKQDVTLKVYPGKDAVFEIYEDAGDGYGYEQGEYTLRKIKWNDSTQSMDWNSRETLPVEIMKYQIGRSCL